MELRQRKFYLALALYLGWILCLGVMAFTSGEPPRPRPAQPAAR
jgi:hypothetical protein